ncbi:MAG: class I SAM-dependent methyltransferase [Thermoanaerobaculia bacterium]
MTGFPLHSECVWPGRRTDLFVAHESIYEFFATFVKNRRVLDAGSGAGYGAAILRRRGASAVWGVDLNPRHVRYARRHFGARGIEFSIANCENLQLEPGTFDLVVSSNVMEHLENPAAFVRAAAVGLVACGEMLLAVPWIVDEASRRLNTAIEFHRSNLTPHEWSSLFAAEGWKSRVWLQTFDPTTGVPDFFESRPTRRAVADFPLVPVSLDEISRPYVLGLLFHLTRE